MKKIFFVILIIMLSPITNLDAKGQGRYVTAPSGLILREAPNTNSRAIATIPYKTKVSIIREKEGSVKIANIHGKWTEINYLDFEGWVFGGFLGTRITESKEDASQYQYSDYLNTKSIQNADLVIRDNKEAIVNWVETPFNIKKNEVFTVFPLYKNIRKVIQLKAVKIEREELEETGDANLKVGYNVDSSSTYIRFMVELEKIYDPEILNYRSPGYPSKVVVIYPAVENISCIPKPNLSTEMLPKNQSFDNLVYALDLDLDNLPDILHYYKLSSFFEVESIIYLKKNKSNWVVINSYTAGPIDEIPPWEKEYRCD